ncbi:poly(ADP-ribose) glycohydrolase domain-containing protein [Micromonospora arborensis]|uniref:poly(ADP-ribose) glycohydrolase domain-containing protein n=1 Tax=Micromonospora arborensis TaxID=2116518 RepID=UPI003CC5519D
MVDVQPVKLGVQRADADQVGVALSHRRASPTRGFGASWRPRAAIRSRQRSYLLGGAARRPTYESTLQAARRLAPGAACLVFASAKSPGGGF